MSDDDFPVLPIYECPMCQRVDGSDNPFIIWRKAQRKVLPSHFRSIDMDHQEWAGCGQKLLLMPTALMELKGVGTRFGEEDHMKAVLDKTGFRPRNWGTTAYMITATASKLECPLYVVFHHKTEPVSETGVWIWSPIAQELRHFNEAELLQFILKKAVEKDLPKFSLRTPKGKETPDAD